jgi:hypothetical protein
VPELCVELAALLATSSSGWRCCDVAPVARRWRNRRRCRRRRRRSPPLPQDQGAGGEALGSVGQYAAGGGEGGDDEGTFLRFRSAFTLYFVLLLFFWLLGWWFVLCKDLCLYAFPTKPQMPIPATSFRYSQSHTWEKETVITKAQADDSIPQFQNGPTPKSHALLLEAEWLCVQHDLRTLLPAVWILKAAVLERSGLGGGGLGGLGMAGRHLELVAFAASDGECVAGEAGGEGADGFRAGGGGDVASARAPAASASSHPLPSHAPLNDKDSSSQSSNSNTNPNVLGLQVPLPDLVRAFTRLAYSLAKRGKFEEALEMLDQLEGGGGRAEQAEPAKRGVTKEECTNTEGGRRSAEGGLEGEGGEDSLPAVGGLGNGVLKLEQRVKGWRGLIVGMRGLMRYVFLSSFPSLSCWLAPTLLAAPA